MKTTNERPKPMKDLENRLLFADPNNKRVLMSLIKATLNLEVADVTVVEGKTIRSKEKKNQDIQTVLYLTEVDLLAVLPDQSKVIIEFQIDYQPYWGKRAFFIRDFQIHSTFGVFSKARRSCLF